MSTTNHRTWQPHHIGHLFVTFQLEPPAEGLCVGRHPGLAALTVRLITLTNTHRVPATWAVNDPAHSAATPTILRSETPHELAILGDANWLGPTAGRTRFAHELARRVLQSRAAGLNVTTIVPRVASVQQDIDLIVKHRISAVVGIEVPLHTGQHLAIPRALHYGVWEMPISGKHPMRSSWLWSAGRILWRQIRRAASDASTFHLVVDVPAVEEEGDRAEHSITWLMRRVAEMRDRGMLQIETLASAAARLSDVPTALPQRSILRSAA